MACSTVMCLQVLGSVIFFVYSGRHGVAPACMLKFACFLAEFLWEVLIYVMLQGQGLKRRLEDRSAALLISTTASWGGEAGHKWVTTQIIGAGLCLLINWGNSLSQSQLLTVMCAWCTKNLLSAIFFFRTLTAVSANRPDNLSLLETVFCALIYSPLPLKMIIQFLYRLS